MADLFLPDEGRALNDALLVSHVDGRASGREHPVDIVGAAPGFLQPGNEAIDGFRFGGFCHALLAKIIEPEIERDPRRLVARNVHRMLFIIEPDDRRERHIFDAGILGVVLARIPLPQELLGLFKVFRAKASAARASSLCVPPVSVPCAGVPAPTEPGLAELEGGLAAFASGHCTLSIR
ncbi:hypothetical protein [Hyphomonas beringensis]|uniref:hypothetical protein n=1 Tax=Hyphomonas beringensis TaxID=1280946 RepID=UPI001F51AA7E|nr:hypothetical protein [Hyphomonas beringensis]